MGRKNLWFMGRKPLVHGYQKPLVHGYQKFSQKKEDIKMDDQNKNKNSKIFC